MVDMRQPLAVLATRMPWGVLESRLAALLGLAGRIQQQKSSDKANDKALSMYAPEVECIGKGKARQPYEFGVKVGICTSHTQGLIVGARAFPNNPFGGHTRSEQLEKQASCCKTFKSNARP